MINKFNKSYKNIIMGTYEIVSLKIEIEIALAPSNYVVKIIKCFKFFFFFCFFSRIYTVVEVRGVDVIALVPTYTLLVGFIF